MGSDFKVYNCLWCLFALLGAVCLSGAAHAGELVYRPISPSFGGNPFISSNQLAVANIENRFVEEPQSFQSDPLDDFTDSIQRRILSELSRDITDAIFGDNAEESGVFEIEGTIISFETVGDEINIAITDDTGASTSITVPSIQSTF